MSRLIYNGVEIPYFKTAEVVQEAVKDDSGTDTMYWHFVVRGSGVIHASSDELSIGKQAGNQFFPLGNPGDSALAAIMKRVRHKLLSPRRGFEYWAGGEKLIDVPARDTQYNALDCRNGPNPMYCNVKRISESAFLIEYAVETWLVDCGEGLAPGPVASASIDQLLALPSNLRPWVSNRWTETVTIDETGRSSKVRRGVLVTRSDMMVSPDQLRGIVAPPIERGFRRVRSTYGLREDGLKLDYEFADEEQYLQPPFPGYSVKGKYTESTGETGKRIGHVYVKLKGQKNVDKGDLIGTAMAACMGKIGAQLERITSGQDKGKWIGSIDVSEDMYEPEVEVSIRAQIRQTPSRTEGLQVALENFTRKPLAGTVDLNGEAGDDQEPPVMDLRGSGGLKLVAAALRDPCLNVYVSTQTLASINEGDGTPDDGVEDEWFDDGGVDLNGQPYPPADVIITTVDPDEGEFDFFDDSEEDDEGNPVELPGVYEQFYCRKHHVQDENVVIIRPADSTTPARTIQLAPPIHRLIVEWFAEKLGYPPQVPEPRSVDPNMILIKHEIEPVSIESAADGETHRYTVSGRYEYEFLNWRDGALNAALPPWMKHDPEAFGRPIKPDPDIIFPPGALDPEQSLTMGQLFPEDEDEDEP